MVPDSAFRMNVSRCAHASRLVVDTHRTADPGDQDLPDIETEADAKDVRRAGARVRSDLLDRKSSVRRPAGGVLDRL